MVGTGKHYDAVIIGAGVIGLGIGYKARLLGLSTLVVERDRPGAGASGVAAGMLAPVTEATFGEEPLLRLNLDSARRYPAFVAEVTQASGIDLFSSVKGTMFVALDRDQLEALRRLHEFQVSLGLDAIWLKAHDARDLEPALHPSARAAIRAKADIEIDPRRLVAALEAAYLSSGGELRKGAGVTALRAGGVTLEAGEEIPAARVVIAAGCWSGTIPGTPPEIAASIRPVKGQILRLRPRDKGHSILGHVIRTEEVYLVPRSGEVVVGATVEEQGFDTTLTAGGVFELLRAADEAVPGLREFELAEASAGLRPGSRDNSPLLGPTSIEGVVAATGGFRNGILLAPVTAEAIATLLAKDEIPDEIAPFDPRRFLR